MAELLVRVAVPRPLFTEFTYSVPRPLLRPGETSLPPGTRVRVPFGRGAGKGSRLAGVVLGPAEPEAPPTVFPTVSPPIPPGTSTPAPADRAKPRRKPGGKPRMKARPERGRHPVLKPIADRFPDPLPAFPEELLALARRLSETTVCPLGLVLRAMAPPGGGGPGRLLAAAGATAAGTARLAEPDRAAPRLSEDDRRVLTLLALSSGPVPLPRLRRELDLPPGRRFDRLAREGLLDLSKTREPADPPPDPAAAPPPRPGDSDPAIDSDAPAPPATPPPTLTTAQAAAAARLVSALEAREFAAFLLHGITGSGKTEVYFRAVAATLAAGRGVILLAPEIALAARLEQLLRERFGPVAAVFHSGLTPAERRAAFWRVRSGEARLVLGVRSAVLAPVRNLGLLILDEEHDGAYQQDEAPRYHAGQVAWMRARAAGAVLLLSSATPALPTAHAAAAGALERLSLPERVGGSRLPTVELVDLREVLRARAAAAPAAAPDAVPDAAGPEPTGASPVFAPRLAESLVETVAAGRQALILLNRRGYGGRQLCLRCGDILECRRCRVALTLHRRGHLAVCHSCGVGFPAPTECRGCGGEVLRAEGFGTQRVEEEAARLLPGVAVGRFDRDATRSRGSHRRLLDAFRRGDLRVLVGTQMIAKGHDFPAVTLVGVVAADAGLGLPDYRAAERAFQLLTQVAGRAGRGTMPGRVVIQTLNPDHYAVRAAGRQDYAGFHAAELEMRRRFRYPPFVRLTRLTLADRNAERAEAAARSLAAAFEGAAGPEVEVLGPAPAPRSGAGGLARWQLLLKADPPAQPEVRRRLRRFQEIPDLSRRLTIETNP